MSESRLDLNEFIPTGAEEAALEDIGAISHNQGSLIKSDGTDWQEFPIGSALEVLRVNAAGTDLEYAAAGAGDVSGPGSSTDNAIARFDGTGGTTLQDSGVTISDTDALSGVASLTIDASGSLSFGAVRVLNDSAGTTTLENIDALDATTVSTIEGGISHDNLNDFAAGEHFTQASITTVGTVTTGNVDAVVSAASATTAGKVELATTAETQTGTDTARAVTPDGLHDMTSLAGAGWFLDEDDLVSDDATKVASQQSIKAYVDATASGANTALSNLAAVAINTSLTSDTDITDDLGTGDIRWKDIHAQTLNAGLTAADTLKLRARDVDGAAYVDILTITSADTPTADLNAITTIGGNAILDASDIGGTVQAQGAVLDDLNTLGAASADGEFIVATAAGVFAYESGATARASMGAGTLDNIVEDTTPQLGGDLDLNGNAIDFPTTANISDVLDEDNMASDSATALATQQSIKKYVDDNAGGGGSTALSFVPQLVSGRLVQADNAFSDNTTAKWAMVHIPHTITVNELSVECSSFTTASTFDIVVYSEDGQTKHIDITTASVDGTGIFSTDVSAVELSAGVYIVAVIANSASVDLGLRGWQFSTQDAGLYDVGFGAVYSGSSTETAGTLPATVDPTTDITKATSSATMGVFIRLDNASSA